MENRERAQKIKMILMDVDGTLTDGKLTLLPDGEELKSYHVRDGLGILLARLAGLKTGIITGKTSKPLEIRAQKLKIMELHQGILDKMRVLEEILHKYGLDLEEVAYIGDDIGDLDVLKKAGLAGTVADAHPVVKKHCHFISAYPGGGGAVREFIELILEAQDKWSVIQQKVKGLTNVSDLT
jgi:3-deoxy-D-manno-octulosonate 8-phosphate phosphatase (KDO 8-P phosphatase)